MPRRILSIDGGGLRGVVALAFLEALEARLRQRHGAAYTIRDHYDLIGGTSTGAIIAAGLALGRSPAELRRFYAEMGPRVFRRSLARIKYLMPLFGDRELEAQIEAVTGDRRLDTPDLRPGGLAIVTKRADTGSVWLVTNNPASKYWEEQGHRGNRSYPLTKVILASAAAPVYFAPRRIEIFEGREPGLFVDGAVSPHNNPALALLQVATIPAYGYSWPTGADELDITAIGTGSYRVRIEPGFLSRLSGGFAVKALEGMMSDCDTQVMTLMQALGRCAHPWRINREIGDLGGACIAPQPLFTFRRYNILLEQDWLQATLGVTVGSAELRELRRVDSVASMGPLHEMAAKAAAMQLEDD